MPDYINSKTRRKRQQRQLWERVVRVFAIVAAIILVALLGYGSVVIVQISVIEPQQPVAQVTLTDGTLKVVTSGEFQKRVRFERAQYERQGLDVDTEALIFGATILDQMILEILARDEAAQRGLTVSEDELNGYVEQTYSYGRITPTPMQTPTVMPGAIPFGPPTPPILIPTPVDEAGYEELYGQDLRDWARLGLAEAEFREIMRAQLLINKLREAIEKPGFTFDDWIAAQQPRIVRLPLWMERFPA